MRFRGGGLGLRQARGSREAEGLRHASLKRFAIARSLTRVHELGCGSLSAARIGPGIRSVGRYKADLHDAARHWNHSPLECTRTVFSPQCHATDSSTGSLWRAVVAMAVVGHAAV